MRLLGQGSPTSTYHARVRRSALIAAVGVLLAGASSCLAAELDVRIRFAWGSGAQSPQKWHGTIAIAGAQLSDLQPLGIEADESAAVQLIGDEIRVAPLVRRAFDGCDVTVRGDESAIVRVEFQHSPDAEPKVVEAPLGEVAGGQLRASLDALGGHLLVHRAPGDDLRVSIDRDHLVFSPGEAISLEVAPDLKPEAAASELTIDATLHRIGDAEVLGEVSVPCKPGSTAPSVFHFPAPNEEGAYVVKLAVRRPVGLADRLAPWEKKGVVTSREIELVVVDPEARLPRLGGAWETAATIDPAHSSWWQRMPQWTQVDKLPGFTTPRALGNVRPAIVPGSMLGLVELPAIPRPSDIGSEGEPAWQAYLLPVRHIGEPHAVEIELPEGVRQHLGVSIVEPDAAGRVMSFGRNCGVYSEEESVEGGSDGIETHRIVFWPTTKSPALVLTNRSDGQVLRYGKIRLLRHAGSNSPVVADDAPADENAQRLVAAYISTPRFAETLGAAENLDSASNLSVDGWSTFLAAANRLAQHLRAAGYNAAIVSVAADGASLAPVNSLGASPRFDTGPLSATGADPLRKDVLEVLLRVFDREGLKLIPAVQFSTPLPRLEALAANGDEAGIRWRSRDGRTWLEHFPANASAAPHYNLLNDSVQRELSLIADELLARYGAHPSLSGLAVQLDGNGYGVLPGVAWGMDDRTAAKFAADQKITLPLTDDPNRFQQRASLFLGQHLEAWKKWRATEVTSFYASLAQRVSQDRPDRRLILCTEELLSGPLASERLRQAVNGRISLDDALTETGVDLKQLAAATNVTLLRPRRLSSDDFVDRRALDHRINGALEIDHAFANSPQAGDLLFHNSSRLRLPTFDAQSPFGADRTHYSTAAVSVPAGDAARQSLAAALTVRDFSVLATGAETLPLVDNPGFTETLRAFQELPRESSDARTERRPPVTMRIYREAESTTVCLINESRWPVSVSVPIEAEADLFWRQLGVPLALGGVATNVAGDPARGTSPRGQQKLELTLAPYGIHARRFSSRAMRVGGFTSQVAEAATSDMARRVAEIEARMAGLNVERSYNELQNPHFELVDENGRLRGWQPRLGKRGAVEVSLDEQPIGRSVHLTSEDTLGVAVQSHMFSTPATGQIVVRAKVRGAELKPGAQLYAWVEYESAGIMRQRYVALGDQSLPASWTEREFAVDDLPLAADGNMRIQFHLTGSGQVWIDDVRLFDLRFGDAQRVELSKRLLGAKAALEEGHLMDCQRLVDSYLPRRLLEHVPPPALAAKPEGAVGAPAADEPGETGIAPRIRNIVPRILR